MDLKADLKLIVEKNLKAEHVPLPAKADLEQLLLLAFNHEMKTVSKTPREVHRSKTFEAKLSRLSPKEVLAAELIIEKFKNGGNVRGHLSKLCVLPNHGHIFAVNWVTLFG